MTLPITPMKHRIFALEAHPITRRGIEAVLAEQSDFNLLETAGTIREANQRVPRLHPDLLITGLHFPDGSGFDLIKSMRARLPGLDVLVFSASDEAIFAGRALRAGACGYVMKSAPTAEFVKRVRQALSGGVAMNERLAAKLLRDLSGRRDFSAPAISQSILGFDRLSRREMEVFELIGDGQSSKEIGNLLGISPRTVDTHKTRIREKLGLTGSNELMRAAFSWQETGTLRLSSI